MFNVNEEVKIQFYHSFERTEKSVNEDVETIKNWMKTQPHLPELMEDVKIKNFLNMNKFSVERTKQKIDMYYTLRSLIPEMFPNPKSEKMQLCAQNTYCCPHPTLQNGTTRIHFTSYKNNTVLIEPMIFFITYNEIRLYEDFMMDDVFVINWRNLQLGDLKAFTPSVFKRFFTVYQKIYSIRMKKVYFVNCQPFVATVTAIIKSILPPKLANRFEVYEDEEVVKQLLPIEELPKDYGGQGPSLQELMEKTKQKLDEYQERFDLLDKLKVDEKLRPQKLDNDEVLGFYGNFKKIDVD